jgi:hypothetical protein
VFLTGDFFARFAAFFTNFFFVVFLFAAAFFFMAAFFDDFPAIAFTQVVARVSDR